MLLQNLPAHIHSFTRHVFRLTGVPGRSHVAPTKRVRAHAPRTLARGVPRHRLAGFGIAVEGTLPAVVVAGSGRGVDVPLNRRFNHAATLRGEEGLPPFFVRHVLPRHLHVVADHLGGLGRDQYVPLASLFVLERRSPGEPVTEFECGPSLVEVPEVKRP